jgi:26S proteasome regulatory subunit N10
MRGSRLTVVDQLALKHRQNKAQRQRIIVFVGSPIAEDEKTLVRLAKRMKKNTIAVDFVNFGEIESENTQKLKAFIEAVNSSDNSHLVTIPPGPHLLSDRLLATPIMGETGSSDGAIGTGEGAAGGEGSGGFEFGFDPNLDPELAMALRMSMEDEKARVARAEKNKEEKEKKEVGEGSSNLENIREEDEHTPLLKDEARDKKDEDGDDKMDTEL